MDLAKVEELYKEKGAIETFMTLKSMKFQPFVRIKPQKVRMVGFANPATCLYEWSLPFDESLK